jgi:hypothetical protein
MKNFQHKFVEIIPDELEEGVLYITIEYCTAIHKCVCGCGNEVVTPLSPKDWRLTFDGKSVSLYPSIGNWGFECQSHYWIKNNNVLFVEKWENKNNNFIPFKKRNKKRKKRNFLSGKKFKEFFKS